MKNIAEVKQFFYANIKYKFRGYRSKNQYSFFHSDLSLR